MNIDMRDAFFERLVARARVDSRIVFLTADHGAFALKEFETHMPERYFNVGISEQSMIGVAAGLASSGKIVFAYGITPFVSLRVLEQLTLDVAAGQLPVNVISVGAGFTYSTDGPTHHGLHDIPVMMTVPHMNILNSSDPKNTSLFVDHAIDTLRPHYIRIEKGVFPEYNRVLPLSVERGFDVLKEGGDNIIISTGSIVHELVKIQELIESKLSSKITIIDLFAPTSFDALALEAYLRNAHRVFTIEESYAINGISSIATRMLVQLGSRATFKSISPQHTFYYQSGSRDYMRECAGIGPSQILEQL